MRQEQEKVKVLRSLFTNGNLLFVVSGCLPVSGRWLASVAQVFFGVSHNVATSWTPGGTFSVESIETRENNCRIIGAGSKTSRKPKEAMD